MKTCASSSNLVTPRHCPNLRSASIASSLHLCFIIFRLIPADEKSLMFREVRRVLKPGGEFPMLASRRRKTGSAGPVARLFHPHQRLEDNSEARVLAFMNQA